MEGMKHVFGNWLHLGLLTLLLLLPGVSTTHAAEAITLRFATLAPEGTGWMNTMHEVDQAVRKETQGRVGFLFYPGGQQGDEKEMLAKIEQRQLHAGAFSGNGLARIVPAQRVLDLPLVFETSEEVTAAQDGLFDHFSAEFEKKGYKLLAFVDLGFVYFFSQKPIRTLEDFRTLKLGVWEGDELAAETIKAFGISPRSIAVPDVLNGLRTGLIDSIYSNPYGAIAMQWHEYLKAVAGIKLVSPTGAIIVRKDIFDRIPPADQAKLQMILQEKIRRLAENMRTENLVALKQMKKMGISLTKPPADSNMKGVYETIRAMRFKLADTGRFYDKALLDRMLGIVAEVRKKRKP